MQALAEGRVDGTHRIRFKPKCADGAARSSKFARCSEDKQFEAARLAPLQKNANRIDEHMILDWTRKAGSSDHSGAKIANFRIAIAVC